MKRLLSTLVLTIGLTVSANAMTYSEARSYALFLSDKMAYELELSDEQYEAVYEINLDYLMSISDDSQLYGGYWTRRNTALEYVLSAWQLSAFRAAEYFYRPLAWVNGRWQWLIYGRYGRDDFYRSKPKAYKNYRGGGREANYYKGRSYNASNSRRYAGPTSSKQTISHFDNKLDKNKSSAGNTPTNASRARGGRASRSTTSQPSFNQAQRSYDSSRKQSEKSERKQQKQQNRQRSAK